MEEKKIKLEVTQKVLEIIFSGLLEIPSKYSLSVIQDLQKQIQVQIEPVTTSEDKPKE